MISFYFISISHKVRLTMTASWKRGKMTSATLVRLVHLWLLWDCVSATTKCAKIVFPDTELENDFIMPVPKSVNLSIYFVFDNSNCPENVKNTDVTITIVRRRASETKDVCKLNYSPNSECVTFSRDCHCPVNGDQRSSLTKFWVQEDETTWVWKANVPDIFQEKNISIQQRYPPEITSLSLYDLKGQSLEAFKPGSSVDVVCAISEGKPSVQPALVTLTNRQVPLEKRNGQWSRRLDNVQCDDSGLLTCIAPGASLNQSRQLLVACPPVIMNQVKDKKWTFLVKSYTKTFISCNVTNHEGTNVDCLSTVDVKEMPPNLLLSFSLSGVDQEADNWTLTLTNEEGHGSFNNTSGKSPVELPVAEEPSKSLQDDSSAGTASTLVHASVIVPFFVILAILSNILSLWL